MNDLAISARGIAKSYRIAHNAPRHTTLGEALAHKFRHGFRRTKSETFWALDDISFDIRHGEVVGIIGRNGAGKSTLLKILSQITEPTRGEIDLHGRVGSLLEVGTGFHPELTGRENIFLNGAILGMKRGEIQKRFDEIVAFAEIEQFLDTPVKRYSSGMYVRLAFAVAAHLEPDVLLVDEVLAVGDVQFQKKCLGKMGEISAGSGRTILFVSHNLSALSALCPRTIYLQDGGMKAMGPTLQVIAGYLAEGAPGRYENMHVGGAQSTACIRRAWIEPVRKQTQESDCVRLAAGDEFTLCVELTNLLKEPVEFVASFYDHLRRPIWYFANSLFKQAMLPCGKRVEIRLTYRLPRLSGASLIVDMALMTPSVYPVFDMAVNALTVGIVGEETAAHTGAKDQFPIVNEPAYRATLHE